MAKLVKPKNKLKEKVGDGGFNPEDLKRAQKQIDENDVDFVPIAERYIIQIKDALNNYDKTQDEQQLHGDLLDVMTQLRAQGSMFHYPTISTITDTVVDLLDSLHSIDETIIEIVQAYDQCARVIVKGKIKNDKDKTFLVLLKELQDACNRYKKKHNK